MKKVLFALLFILIGILLAGFGIFAVAKIKEAQTGNVAVDQNNDQEEEDDTTVDVDENEDVEELVVFDEGYYSVYYQQCGITLPFPEAVEFSYLNSNSSDYVESDNVNDRDLGWYLSDSSIIATQALFFGHFEHAVSIGMGGLPYTSHLGSDYISASVSVQCYAGTTETLQEAFERIEAEVEAAAANPDIQVFDPFAVTDVENVTYDGLPAIQFVIQGGFFGGQPYTIVRNDSHVFVMHMMSMSSDANIEGAAEYVVENVIL